MRHELATATAGRMTIIGGNEQAADGIDSMQAISSAIELRSPRGIWKVGWSTGRLSISVWIVPNVQTVSNGCGHRGLPH